MGLYILILSTFSKRKKQIICSRFLPPLPALQSVFISWYFQTCLGLSMTDISMISTNADGTQFYSRVAKGVGLTKCVAFWLKCACVQLSTYLFWVQAGRRFSLGIRSYAQGVIESEWQELEVLLLCTGCKMCEAQFCPCHVRWNFPTSVDSPLVEHAEFHIYNSSNVYLPKCQNAKHLLRGEFTFPNQLRPVTGTGIWTMLKRAQNLFASSQSWLHQRTCNHI